MSQTNAEIARAYFEAFDRHDLVAAAQFLDSDVAWDWDDHLLIDEEAIQGREAVREYWERILATSPFAHEDHQFLEADDRVCVLANIRVQGAGSGVELAQPCGYALTLRGGAIIRSLFYFDQSHARQAVGLASV
jgi:ketosteroid isomerase-like protein